MSNKALDKLRSASPTTPAEQTSADSPAPALAYLVYQGKTGEDHGFDHTGDHTVLTAVGCVTFEPGLTILAGESWAAAEAHVVDMIEDGRISVTSASLKGWSSPDKYKVLAKSTTQPRALEHLLKIETAKPHTGPRRSRQDPELRAYLAARLLAYSRVSRPDYSGILPAAQLAAERARPRSSPQRQFAGAERANTLV